MIQAARRNGGRRTWRELYRLIFGFRGWRGGERHEPSAGGRTVRVSAASISRWRALARERGEARPRPQGGDRRSGRVEAHRDMILGMIEETPDMTIEELRQALAKKDLI
jgi:hypothetical protein